MKRKKVLVQQEIVTDETTGEIIKNSKRELFETKQVHKTRERFKFMPESSDIYLNLQGGTYHKVGYILLDYQNAVTGEIEVTRRVKDVLSQKINIKRRMIELAIKELVNSNVLTPIVKSTYLINPMFIYKGGTVDLENRIKTYNSARSTYLQNLNNDYI